MRRPRDPGHTGGARFDLFALIPRSAILSSFTPLGRQRHPERGASGCEQSYNWDDSRDYSKSSVQEKHAPKGPRPVTPTSLSELDELLAKADDEDMRGGMLRALEYFGATRLDTHAMRIPRGLGPEAPTEDIAV